MIDEERLDSSLAIALFGPFHVRLGGRPLPPPRSQKIHWLLALLALQEGRAVNRAWLAGLLWPESSEQQAGSSLRRNLWHLRLSLGPEADRLQSPTPGTLRLDLTGAEADVLVFDEAVARGDTPSLERAVALHRGPLLQGCEEEWVLPERERRELAYLDALEQLAAAAMARDDHAQAVRCLRRIVATDPLRDSSQRALMQALAAAGDVGAATQIYRDFRLRLHTELNATPDAETTALYQRIRTEARRRAERGSEATRQRDSERHDGATTDAEPPPAGSLAPSLPRSLTPSLPPSNLPRPISSLVGREREITAVGATLGRSRLVTLAGPGGVGKTRLALEVARQSIGAYPDGAWFVDLAALTDPELVAGSVARTLRIGEQPARLPPETLTENLGPKRLLLVLDNCEHLLGICAQLAESLLGRCAELHILATSRQALGLPGETVWEVAPLSLPERLKTDAPADLLHSDAIRLFVERANAIGRPFALTAGNAEAVETVCRRLDGMPLAIELAAARLQGLSVAQLARHLEDRFRFLAQGSRTAPPRQRTLGATLDWSYELLTEPERTLLRRLSVFVGGWRLEAAEQVCDFGFSILDFRLGGSTMPSPGATLSSAIQNPKSKIQNPQVLDLLTSLVDKSLVVYEEHAGESRYRLLETTREYARERLEEVGEAATLRVRHRDWCLAFAELADAALRGPEQVAWLNRLEADHDNMRAALDWNQQLTTDHGQLTTALRLAGALGWFWRVRGYHVEARGRIMELLARVEQVGVPTAGDSGGVREEAAIAFEAARARVLYAVGTINVEARQMEAARAQLEMCLSLARRSGDRAMEMRALLALGLSFAFAGASDRARTLYEESLAVARAIGDQRGIVLALNNLGGLGLPGDAAAARSYYEHCLELCRSLGDLSLIALLASNLGHQAREVGDLDAAERYYTESLTLTRRLGNWVATYHELVHLGCLALERGRDAEAEARFAEAVEGYRPHSDRIGIAWAHQFIGCILVHESDRAPARAQAVARAHLEEALALARECRDGKTCARALAMLGRLALREGLVSRARELQIESLRIGPWHEILAEALAILERMGAVDVASGQPERAARLLGAVEALREAYELPLQGIHGADFAQTLAATRGALEEMPFAAAWAEGRRMSLAEAVAFAAGTPSTLPEVPTRSHE